MWRWAGVSFGFRAELGELIPHFGEFIDISIGGMAFWGPLFVWGCISTNFLKGGAHKNTHVGMSQHTELLVGCAALTAVAS